MYFVTFILFLMEILLATTEDPDLGLHCLSMTLLRVSSLQWVRKPIFSFQGEDAKDKQEA